MNMYHYTCDCALEKIEADNWLLKPNLLTAKFGLPVVVWLTDMEQPDKQALGLTSRTLPCDRTQHRLAIPDTSSVVPWSQWCRANNFTRAQRDVLEVSNRFGSASQAQPRRWFVSSKPIWATLDY